MIPDRHRLHEIAQMSSGQLQQIRFGPLLRALVETRQSVTLEVRRQQVYKRIQLEGGVPVECQSNLAHEKFGRFLVSVGRLSETDFTATFSESLKRGMRHGEVLVARELISPSELFRLLQQGLAKKLLDLFSWPEGEFKIEESNLGASAPLKVRPYQLILTGIQRFALQDEIDEGLAPYADQAYGASPVPPIDSDDLRLSKAQGALFDQVDGAQKTVAELAEATGDSVDSVRRSLYALALIGIVLPTELLEQESKLGSITQPVPRVRFVPQSQVTTDEVAKAFLEHRDLDPFDLLMVTEDASSASIEHKFLEYARRYAPWSFQEGELAGVQEQAHELFLAGARAYAALTDEQVRNELMTRRLQPLMEAESSTRGQVQPDLLDSEEQYAKGMELMESDNLKDALHYLEFASFCDPQNGLYQAQLAWCQFQVDRSTAERILHRLTETHRVDPKCGEAFLYAGEIAMELERHDLAETYLRHASSLMSPDRRALDKLEELSHVRG